MKRIFTLLMVLAYTGLFGQISINPGTLSATISETKEEHVYEVSVTNSGNAAVNLWWKIFKPTWQQGWQVFVCDSKQCYTPSVESAPASKPNPLAAGATQVWTVHFKPNNIVGSGKMYIELYNDSALKTMVAKSDEGAMVIADKLLGTKNINGAEIKIYPNPADDYFTIKNDVGVAKISIHNIIGKEMASYIHNSGNTYDISEYNRGVYIIRMIDSRGKTLRSVRLSKR